MDSSVKVLSPEAWTQYGIVGLMLAVGVFFAWKSGVFIAGILREYVPKLVDKHNEFIDSVKECQLEQTHTNKINAESFAAQTKILQSQETRFDELIRFVKSLPCVHEEKKQ